MAVLRLNRNRPFGQVFGWEGVSFQQDGRHFRHDGSLVGEPVEVVIDTSNAPPRGSADEISWLKNQLEIYNQPYSTPAKARAFLAGKDD